VVNYNRDADLDPIEIREANEKRKQRREWLIAIVLFILFLALTWVGFRLTKFSSTLPFVNSMFFFGLLNINVILLIAVLWLVFRNIGKLFLERRRNLLGSRLKAKLVTAFLGFSITPTLVLFVISALYINSSFDKWFSIKIQNPFQASLEITRMLYRNADQTALHFADHISTGVRRRIREVGGSSLSVRPEGRGSWFQSFLEEQRSLLALDAVELYFGPLDERILVQKEIPVDLPGGYPRASLDLLEKAFRGDRVSTVQHLGAGDLIRVLVPVRSTDQVSAVVIVNTFIPVSLVSKIDEIASVFDDYQGTNPLKYPMKTAYFVILVLITMVIIVVAIWLGLYLARELTVPVERLVKGAKEVGDGNLDVTIAVKGQDEISVLVDSFNRMTAHLKQSRESLNQANRDLDKRRIQVEAILANIGTGVLVVDRNGATSTFNASASRIFEKDPAVVVGRPFRDVFSEDEFLPLRELIEEALGQKADPKVMRTPEVLQWGVRMGTDQKALASVASPLFEEGRESPWGAVIVIDDLTYLIKGQREMAWREVARRIAHEIKNPLTPIKLSAQRIQRRFSTKTGVDGEVLRECTEMIVQHVDELRDLVNEFSDFARFPEVSPAPNDLNAAIREVHTLYVQAHPSVSICFEPDTNLPIFEFDRDQMKRVLINLMDNAVAALEPSSNSGESKRIEIHTQFHEALKLIGVTVRDNGPGMPDEVLSRVFEPYFSTKSSGTGLGLAIAKRIVNDHDGVIRVHSELGKGTQFLIEIPQVIRSKRSRS